MRRIDLKKISEAAGILKNGGIVVYPTETVYGIGCDPLNKESCERVQALKHRNDSKPFILIADSVERVEEFAGQLAPQLSALARIFWPGALTMVIRPEKQLPLHLHGPSGGVAFRVTPHPVAAALVRKFGRPVVSTSANITEKQPVTEYGDAVRLFGDKAGIVLENTITMQGLASTVVDMTSPEPKFLRIGTISKEQMMKVM